MASSSLSKAAWGSRSGKIFCAHSMEGIYDKDHAPLFASDKAEDWVRFLEKIWGSTRAIEDIKKRDKEYLEAMEKFVDSEYKRFLDA